MAHLGPATYDVNSQSIAVQSIRDAILKKTMKGNDPYYGLYRRVNIFLGGFGTNSKRSDGTLRSNTVDVLPGPGHYEIRTDMKTNKPSESAFGTSCFTSMSNRMQNSLKAQVRYPRATFERPKPGVQSMD